jgi:hypothetical protein
VCRDADRFDAGLGKSKLKGVTNKLRAVVIDKPIGARVTRQLMVLKQNSGVVGCFGTLQSDDFNEVSNRFEASEGVESHDLRMDFHLPRTNEINVYLVPGQQGSMTRSQVTMGTSTESNFWTDRTIGDAMLYSRTDVTMEEMTSD